MRTTILCLSTLLVVSSVACSSSETITDNADASVADAGTDASTASDAASGTDAGADAAAGPGNLTWKDDGTPYSASGTAESLSSASGPIGFAMNLADPVHLVNISLNVFTATSADWKPGTYPCPTPGSLAYITGGKTTTVTACSITVTDIGAVGGGNLKGTFTGSLTLMGGGSKAITEGAFDIPYKKP